MLISEQCLRYLLARHKTIIADITVLVVCFFAVRKMREVPSGLQNLAEWFIEVFEGLLSDIAGKEKARQWFPMFMTIMLFRLSPKQSLRG